MQRRKKNSGLAPIIIFIAVVAAILGGLYWMGGEKPVAEQNIPVELNNDMGSSK
ncbi:hypothetical protein [Sphingorhabdus lutea]|uniref:hypothetical protein n=1 Tax=Sphingorhabdus lutea TaxID=1913578 RepID=UPI000A927F06|nr:hypothetical protein [Sphingorhabdus lutea]